MTSLTAKACSDMSDFNISVVIPVHNRAKLITRALDSVLAQTIPAQEVIIVDDGSTDNNLSDVLTKYQDKIVLIQQENLGVSAVRNIGIQQATGNWIALLDSDDSWQINKLEQQVAVLSAKPDYKLCHTNETWYRDGEELTKRKT